MRMFGFLIIVVSLLVTILSSFNYIPAIPSAMNGLLDPVSFICVMGSVLGGCLVAYGSDTYKGCGAILKPTLSREEAAIAVGVYKLAVRISIGSGFFGAMYGWIALLRHEAMGGGGSDGAMYSGVAVSLVAILYGLVFAFTIFLPLQYYSQYQLDKDS